MTAARFMGQSIGRGGSMSHRRGPVDLWVDEGA